LYQEHTGLIMTMTNPTEMTLLFTRIAPMDPNRVHEVALKMQPSTIKAMTKPPIKITKAQLNDLNKKESWKEFLVYVRQQFASLYEG